MKTAMQELRDDLVATLKTGDEALNEIQDISIRESCQKVVQLTLESIIKRIDDELLEMEKEQKIKFAENCLDKALVEFAVWRSITDFDEPHTPLGELKIWESLNEQKIPIAFERETEQYYNETFKQQEQ